MLDTKHRRIWISTASLAKEMAKDLREDYDVVVALTGREGVGKSTHSIQLAKKISKYMNVPFSLKKNVVYMPKLEDIRQKFNKIGRYQTLILDEAIKVLYKLNWMDKLQKELNEHYATERKQNKVTLLNIPRFLDLNEYFRNHRVRWWIHHIYRDPISGMGFGVIYKYIDNEFSKNPWNIKEGEDLSKYTYRNKHIRDIENSVILELNWRMKHPNFYAFVSWDKLDEKEMKKYIKYCDAAKKEYSEWENEEEGLNKEEKLMKERRKRIDDAINDIVKKYKNKEIKRLPIISEIQYDYLLGRNEANIVSKRIKDLLVR